MENKNLTFKILQEQSDEEFFDAFESFEDSAEKLPNVPPSTGNKEFSPISKFYQSQPEFSTNDFAMDSFNTNRALKISNQNLRNWKIKELRKNNKDNFEFNKLKLIQEFEIIQKNYCLINFSPDGRFISIAGDEPLITLYEVCRQKFEDEQYLMFDEPFERFAAHTSGVTSIVWSVSSLFFLSSALDGMVYKWSIAQQTPVGIFRHNVEVVCMSIHPQNQELFFSGCKDNRARIWNMNTSLVDSDFDLESEITAGEFSPNGLLIIGLSKGFCLVLTYNCFSRLIEILTKVDCRNKKGPKSEGRPITGIEFVSEDLFLVTTNDSRIRLFSAENYEIKQKYKGLKNEHSKLVASVGKYSMHVICGSENGNVYIWNLFSKFVPKLNPVFTKKKRYKNSSYEYFSVDNYKLCLFPKLAPEKVILDVQRRYTAAKQSFFINNIILVAKAGSLLVFYNKEAISMKSNKLSKSFA